MTILPPPPRVGPEMAELRRDLLAADYGIDAVAERVGPPAQQALAREESVPALRALGGDTDRLAVLIRLLMLADGVRRGDVDAALPATGTDGLIALGIATAAGAGHDDQVRAFVDVEPQAIADDTGEGAWWVVSDHGEMARHGELLPVEHVLGVGTASMTLIEAVLPPSPGDVVADVGCGSGIQALHLSRFTDRLLASDASSRAAAFARVTFDLNRVPAQVVVGDLLEPLGGARLDRVVANLPFVITPRHAEIPQYVYRDSGAVGDAVSARMVREAPARLADGGIAQFLANWEVPDGASWDDRIRDWVSVAAADAAAAGDVVDVWVVQRDNVDPALYAESWIADGVRPCRDTAALWYRAWLDDFAGRGVEAVGFGIVTMRRRRAGYPPLRRYDDRPEPLPAPLRDGLGAGLAGHDALAALGALADDTALLGARLTVADGVVERREHDPGAVDPRSVHLVDTRRFGRMIKASVALGGVVGACDGELPVAAITSAVAQLLDEGEGAVRAQVLPSLRRMVAEGMLVVAG